MTTHSAMSFLIPLPVVLSLLGAGICLALGHNARAQRVVGIVTLSVVVAIAAVLLAGAYRDGPQVVHVGGWPARLGIVLVADSLSALLLLTSAIVTLCVLVYSVGQGIVEFGPDTPLSVFYPTFLVLSAGVSNAFLSGDLFNLYVGFEVLLAASYVLITLGGTGPRVRAGSTYVVVSVLSSVVFLVALAGVYAATGTVNMADLSEKLQAVPSDVRTVLQLLLLTAFCIKAAVFPLSAWLPDSYPTAPAPVTAVFAGLLTKVGVYAIIRVQTILFPENHLTTLLLWGAAATMVIGILGAVAQSDIKRMLSFTLISHIGFMIFGIALASHLGLASAIFYTVHHITIQTTLFLVAGLIEIRGGSTALERLGGLAKAAPFLALMFFLPAMNLAGIPPLSGYFGKVGLAEAGIAAGGWLAYLVVAASIVTSLLTLYAIAKTWNRAFWRPPDPETAPPIGDWHPSTPETPQPTGDWPPSRSSPTGTKSGEPWAPTLTAVRQLPAAMVGPTVALVALSTAITLVAGPLFGIASRAATELGERTPYVTAVLEDGSGITR
ncbi:NADH/Ubiquinone/plastoquinone (Complex I) [Nostocoides japonicum T1-X7]|uniref:NADH/Ubiquinone/plastoquinone (Complex I) n=1 Tax=Nostocoides japonicum T1-X7 TaxID=1194083 RepID=A0A077LU89_9MICO|nr:Na+/H+ antiporter subunit D [Tetrasphaera japonica]CCH77046.1 NADH/Ubiquinone/plastoquinone (Complex I) [Tetrasphaera japonica T1-X7]